MRTLFAAGAIGTALGVAACGAVPAGEKTAAAKPLGATASEAFWKVWGDGNAELDAYAATIERYGSPRKASVVLIYVTEPMDRRVWIKDDAGDVPAGERVNVMKLNRAVRFQTGIYPYSVLTSVFAPVDGLLPERFAPVKIAFTAQEWCGSVWHKLTPAPASFASEVRSYFHGEGERNETVPVKPGTLYEDALPIQLRELDGPFASGRDWSGEMVPSLWVLRAGHTRAASVPATISRVAAVRDGAPVSRFTVNVAGRSTTYDVETAPAHRLLGWRASNGEEGRLVKTARLPYWRLNGKDDAPFLPAEP